MGAEKDKFAPGAAFRTGTACRTGTARRTGATLGASESAFGTDIWTFRNHTRTHDIWIYGSPEHIDHGSAGDRHDGYERQARHDQQQPSRQQQ